MSNKFLKTAGTAALIIAANFSFAQVNLGGKASANAGAKVNTDVVNKTAAATHSAVSATAQKSSTV